MKREEVLDLASKLLLSVPPGQRNDELKNCVSQAVCLVAAVDTWEDNRPKPGVGAGFSLVPAGSGRL